MHGIKSMRNLIAAGSVVALLGTAGCSGLSTGEQRTLTGGAAGAAGGAAIGALTGGSAALGAIIGGAAGAAGGYLYNEHEKSRGR